MEAVFSKVLVGGISASNFVGRRGSLYLLATSTYQSTATLGLVVRMPVKLCYVVDKQAQRQEKSRMEQEMELNTLRACNWRRQ